MRIGLAQINPIVGALEKNKEKILQFTALAQEKEVDLLVFPELALCGYPPEDLLLKDYFIGQNLKTLKELAASVKGITLIVGFVDQDKNKNIYNAAALISDGRIKSIYHKHCLPNYGVFDEERYFEKGGTNQVYALGNICFGVSICEDIWDENGPCLKQAEMGAQLLINISSSPFDVEKLKIRQKILKERAKSHAAYVAYVNIVGGQDELVFDGCSMLFDPLGKQIAQAVSFEEDLIIRDLNIPALKRIPRKAKIIFDLPILKKSPIFSPAYKQETKVERVYKALVLGTRDYVNKNGFKKVVIGLSGGIDSSLVAAIAVDALGKENVIGVTMPSQFTSKETRSDAEILAKNLGIEFKILPVEAIFHSYESVLSEEFKGWPSNIAEENIQARIRGNLLMALSNKFGWLVLTTGNKSEIAVGYCTLYGDMSGGFAVIKDVPKTLVYELSNHKNKIKFVIPQSVIERAPSAELRHNQKDQDSLPPYEILDKILELYVEKHKSFKQINFLYNKDVVEKVLKLIDRSEYKRRQSPPGVKITPRAFGKDWRLPITNGFVQ